MRTRTVLFTVSALVAFAANSLLCRQALGHAAIDAASFSTIRLASGAAVLLLITRATRRGSVAVRGTWGSAAMLFLYAVPFSFAYVSLGAGGVAFLAERITIRLIVAAVLILGGVALALTRTERRRRPQPPAEAHREHDREERP